MIYEITFRESRGNGISTFTVDATTDEEAIRLLGFHRGKNAVKHIIRFESLGVLEEETPLGSPLGI